MARHFGLTQPAPPHAARQPVAREPVADDPLTMSQLIAVACGFLAFTAALSLLLGSILPWAYRMMVG